MSKCFTVLIADGSAGMRTALREILIKSRLEQFDFDEAADGQEASTKWDPRRVDLAFFDWDLPGISDMELVRLIRNREDGRRIALVLTGCGKKLCDIQQTLDDVGDGCLFCQAIRRRGDQYKLGRLLDRLSPN